MLRNRLLIFLGVCFLTASAAWADDVGYIDCSKNSEGAQVFGKPRRTPDVVASLPCGERFTILLYGFVFSRIQTTDGKVGYIYSNIIVVDRDGASMQKQASSRMVTASEKVVIPRAPAANPNPPAPVQPQAPVAQPPTQSMSAQQAPEQASASVSSVAASPAPTASAPTTPVQTAPAPSTNVTETSAAVAPSDRRAATQPQPASPQLSAAPASASSTPEPSAPASASPTPPTAGANVPESNANIAQPDPPAQPQPSPAQPAAQPIRRAEARASWERPLSSARNRAPRVEVFGGYAFTRLDGGAGTATNLNGAMGSFGWNFKPWLQLVADSSYSVVTIAGTKNILYGNHFGPRYFHRGRNRWGLTPFVEALVGGSREDATVTGTGGYTISANCLSYKVGGGLDLHPSRRWEIRLFDVDYYRTSFGTGVHQNNYWATTGIVLRLFGGAE